jgi:hypothetical protein
MQWWSPTVNEDVGSFIWILDPWILGNMDSISADELSGNLGVL